jgi:hypothetical protein
MNIANNFWNFNPFKLVPLFQKMAVCKFLNIHIIHTLWCQFIKYYDKFVSVISSFTAGKKMVI